MKPLEFTIKVESYDEEKSAVYDVTTTTPNYAEVTAEVKRIVQKHKDDNLRIIEIVCERHDYGEPITIYPESTQTAHFNVLYVVAQALAKKLISNEVISCVSLWVENSIRHGIIPDETIWDALTLSPSMIEADLPDKPVNLPEWIEANYSVSLDESWFEDDDGNEIESFNDLPLFNVVDDDIDDWLECHLSDYSESDFNEALSEHRIEVFQWYIVTDSLARDLEAIGEVVLDEPATLWGRQCAGQALYMDHTFLQVAINLIQRTQP